MAEVAQIKWQRIVSDSNCHDCNTFLPMGMWAYVNTQTQVAICPKCGVQHGWTTDDLAKKMLAALQIDLEVKALKKEKKVLSEGVAVLRGQIDIYRLAELNRQAEMEMAKADALFQQRLSEVYALQKDYLQHVGEDQKEKEIMAKFHNLQDKMLEDQRKLRQEYVETQREVREHIEPRMFYFTIPAKKKKDGEEQQRNEEAEQIAE